MRSRMEAMGLTFNPEALSGFQDTNMIELGSSMGLSATEIAGLLINKIAAAQIERELPKCVWQRGDGVLISMPLDDLRFAYGFMALVEADAHISKDQTKRALQIADKLLATTAANGGPDGALKTWGYSE